MTTYRNQSILDHFLTAARSALPHTIKCESKNLAIHLRYRMYSARKALRGQVAKEVKEFGHGFPLEQRLVDLESVTITLDGANLIIDRFKEPNVTHSDANGNVPTVTHNPVEWTPAEFIQNRPQTSEEEFLTGPIFEK